MGNDDDPVADVSFLAGEVKEIVDDLFSGVIIDGKFTANGNHLINYVALGNFFAQQPLLATMSNLQHFANLNAKNPGISNGSETNGGYSSPLPDIFQSNFPNPAPTFSDEQFEERGSKSI
ncbi:hypothetical protein SLEP1_g36346 [Rubroshorea leprosula]|uniref:Uncharacterized protein n=1 Tax=Rubroshorea leprosula TaxID=152421 RepID=A0AAV5KRP0_9ROSI|nr:hypothetical protein SLEP1_g36346 [Rubroshorea leprosula]